jgi:uncharacterized protein YjbI with pentapeptide repeats
VLKGANLIGVDLSSLALFNADASEIVRVDDSPEALNKLQEMITAHTAWVDTGGAKGARAEFTKADLSGLDLSGSHLTGAVFKEAKLRGTKLMKASLNLATFQASDLSGVDLTGAELRGVRFDESNLENALFCDADLGVETVRITATKSSDHASVISACQMSKANFTGAKAAGLVAKGLDLNKIVASPEFLSSLSIVKPAD